MNLHSQPHTIFWPPDHQHNVVYIDLEPEIVPPEIRRVLPEIYKLAALGDAIRALQAEDGCLRGEQALSGLFKRSADLLIRIAGSLPSPVGEILELRAAGLLGAGHVAAAIRQAEIHNEPLVLQCGPLATWSTKSERTMHSVFASVPVHAMNAMIARAHSLLEHVVRYLQSLLGFTQLELGQFPSFLVTKIIACGGEANTFPKHFAYFLPRDEGVEEATSQKTIVFANVYQKSFHLISMPLAEGILEPFEKALLTPESSISPLLLWLRGHDLGHFLRLPETDYQALDALGLRTRYLLEEAIADTMGYLMVANGPWQEAFRLNPTQCGTAFLCELLRYLRRGPTWFSDSGSAFLELSYLLSHGYVSLTKCGKKLSWHPSRLYDGVVELTKSLIELVLCSNLELAEQLLARHTVRPDHPLRGFLAHLTRQSRHIPTVIAYHMPHAQRCA